MSTTDTYTLIHISTTEKWQQEILIAALSEMGFEGFEEVGHTVLKAFIPASAYEPGAVKELLDAQQLSFTESVIEPENWNATWESNFQPVAVEGFCTVRAGFHPPATDTPYEVIITPKMSFGTGHHATTYMMMQAMQQIDFSNKKVLDFGTGTGILAILAEKLGADEVTAIDNDDWCIENATENIAVNSCSRISLYKDTHPGNAQTYDIILANINKNVLLNTITQQKALLAVNGIIVMSGLLHADADVIIKAASAAGLALRRKWEKGDWIALEFV